MNSVSKKKPNVYEVAELAGISIATVSRALNQPHRVAADTRERVMKAVKELDYVPDVEAAARARSAHTRIAVVSPVYTYPGFASRLRGIVQELETIEAEVIVFHVDTNRLKEKQQYKYFDSLAGSGRYDAIIIMSVPLCDQYLDRLANTKFPTVLIETEDPRFPTIQVDHQYGSKIATSYLIQKGYENIGFIGFDNSQKYALDASAIREKGFMEALEEKNLKINHNFIYHCAYGIDSAYETVKNAWKNRKRPQAIFCASDASALGVMKAAKELKISIPKDLAVVGFDDIEMADYMNLTTIRNPLESTGRAAGEMIKALLGKSPVATRKLLLDLELVERQTA